MKDWDNVCAYAEYSAFMIKVDRIKYMMTFEAFLGGNAGNAI